MQITPLERLKRLQQFSALMTAELTAMVEDMEVRPPSAVGLDKASLEQFASSASTIGLDLQAIAKQIEIEPANQAALLEAAMNTIWGAKGVALKYLSPTVMEGGRGFIKPSNTFKQYDDDVMRADAERVLAWPAGFYRNRETREDQLLIQVLDAHSDIQAICFDSLPSNVGQMRFIAKGPNHEIYVKGLVDLSLAQFVCVEKDLQIAFANLDTHHFNPSCLTNLEGAPPSNISA